MEYGKYSFVIDSMDFSYSRLSSFDDCKYKWFMRYLLDEKEEEMFFASYGKFMHSLLERFYKKEITKSEMLSEYITSYSASVRGERPDGNIAESYFKNGLEYLKSFTPLPYKVLAVEERAEIDLFGYHLVGYPDLVCEDEDGVIIIVDNKSADLKPRSNRNKPTQNDQKLDKMLIQLYIYAAFVEKKYGKLPGWFLFNCYRTNTIIREPFVYEKYYQAKEWVKDKIAEIRMEEDFPPNVEYFFCKHLCGLHNECVYYPSKYKKRGA